ncbi:hypothetical protein LZZ90_09785 [Flavobacterium sp. SM15]|uniref:hypothetical protein n=1 Tax=Flavobacterium sp. SM15 TaxID=2908005 RepID=UPI001EDC23F2|nr:hypothetical protein [Flavobacterium sp. SM15]MCG2611793.1 hypothetical protein [Flavobacterium sp. SM15]
MKKLISLIVIVLLLFSCSHRKGKIELALTKEIENCNTPDCRIELKKVTDFEWDKVYFFEIPTDKEYVNKCIGIDYPNYVEFTRPIIFLNKGKIVYSENNVSSVESLVDEQIVIGDIIDTTKVRVFTPKEAIFKSAIKENDNLKYYELTPLEK